MANEITAEQVAELRALQRRAQESCEWEADRNFQAALAAVLPALLTDYARLQGLEARVKGAATTMLREMEAPACGDGCCTATVLVCDDDLPYEEQAKLFKRRVALLALDGEGVGS